MNRLIRILPVRFYATARRSKSYGSKSYGQTKGKTLQAPKHSKPQFKSQSQSQSQYSSKPTNHNKSKPTISDPNLPYKFGSYSGLKLPEENRRKRLESLISKITDFNELKLLPEIRDVLINEIKKSTVLRTQNNVDPTKKVKTESELNGLIIRPTPIQTASIKLLNSDKGYNDMLKVYTLAAETGSGKTWAYLAPMLHLLKETEAEAQENGDRVKAGIKNIIFVPTHELVDQVYKTLENISEGLNLKIYKWDTDTNFLHFIEHFKQSIDIMVTTPGKLLSLTKYDSIANPKALLNKVKFCVVDEADTLMDKSFMSETYSTLRHMSNLSNLVFVSATFPSEFNKSIEKLFPDSIPISTPSLHKLPKSIEFRVINASVAPYKGSKMKAMAQALYAIHCDGTERGFEKRVIVFVNLKEDAPKVAKRLQEKYNHDATFISSDDTAEERKDKIKDFIEPPKLVEDPARPILKVLVCTDLVSRGINFSGIRNVILLDVPKTSIDLVHRAGRTGRMNQSGRVFLIMTDQDKSHVKGLPKVIRNNRRLA